MSKEVVRYLVKAGSECSEMVYASDYDALLEENQQLRQLTSEKVINATMLREFVARDGGLTIGLEGGACALMAQAFGQQMYESEALNYIEASFDSPDYPELGQITVTLKREAGKTPHQLRKEAEAERDALLAERDAYKKDAERYRAFRKAGLPNGLGVYDAELDAACDELIEEQREDV
ncbi:hypothetical protein AUR59_020280 [Stutzerimonas balearica]|uniref:hypothetical protein n=1 Tax=Stutzerimonas balearica TaxID=74829 RepID=UPI000970F334|nr:hypothetical protein [Stutzerimonas balearica]OMG61499.1 hypothetical protein AUR59_020280 [Stutzerimonas balearica]